MSETQRIIEKAREVCVAEGAENPPLRSLIWRALQAAAEDIESKISLEDRFALLGCTSTAWPGVRKQAERNGIGPEFLTVIGWLQHVTGRAPAITHKYRRIVFSLAHGQPVASVRAAFAPEMTDGGIGGVKSRALRQIEDWILVACPEQSTEPSPEIEQLPGVEDISHLVKKRCGVYFLFRKGQLFYIGQSGDIVARVLQHAKYGAGIFDRVLFVPVPRDDLLRVEAEMIERFKPERNLVRPKVA